jgi:hypothetical protein
MIPPLGPAAPVGVSVQHFQHVQGCFLPGPLPRSLNCGLEGHPAREL